MGITPCPWLPARDISSSPSRSSAGDRKRRGVYSWRKQERREKWMLMLFVWGTKSLKPSDPTFQESEPCWGFPDVTNLCCRLYHCCACGYPKQTARPRRTCGSDVLPSCNVWSPQPLTPSLLFAAFLSFQKNHSFPIIFYYPCSKAFVCWGTKRISEGWGKPCPLLPPSRVFGCLPSKWWPCITQSLLPGSLSSARPSPGTGDLKTIPQTIPSSCCLAVNHEQKYSCPSCNQLWSQELFRWGKIVLFFKYNLQNYF